MASKAFTRAEALTTQYFRLPAEAIRSKHYDVKTLAHLKDHEISEGAFAHICKYRYEKACTTEVPEDLHFYRICLQDGRILDAVDRGHSFVKLDPLLLYIAVHELVHVFRFEFEKIDFDASEALKVEEEEKVHSITRNMLLPVTSLDLKLVLECFSRHYQIGDWMH